MANNYRTTVNDIVQKTSVTYVETQVIQDYLTDLLNTVHINSDELALRLEAILKNQNSDGNILRKLVDALVSIFGMNLVSSNGKVTVSAMSPADENLILSIDKERAQTIVSALLGKVDDMIKNSRQLEAVRQQAEKSASANNQSIDVLRRELDSAQSQLESLEKRTLHGIQRMLAQQPELQSTEDDDQNAFLLYLGDLNITWSWNAQDAPDDFTSYKVSDPASEGIRLPCLYRDGTLVLRGLRYILDSTESDVNPHASDT